MRVRRTVLLFEVTNSGYYDITIPSGATSAGGWSSDVTPDNYGGSPSGYGIGYQYDFSGFNTATYSRFRYNWL